MAANIDYLAERRALWDDDGQKASGLISDRILKRKFTDINLVELAEAAEILRLRTSVKNPDDGKKYYTVTAPMVNQIEVPGLWRCVAVETTEDPRTHGTITQTLALGWAETLIDTEARLVGGDNQPLQPARTIQREYVALNYIKLGDMIETIENTKYVTNPVIEGKTYDEPPDTDLKWRILSSKPSRAADGSGVITQTLAKNLVMTPDALPTAILLSDDKALLSPFAHDTTSAKNAYIWEYRWIDPAYAQTLRDTIALVSGVIDAKIIKVEDGSCNIQVLTQTNTWAGTLSQIWEYRNNFPTFAANQIIDSYSHIPLASLSGFKTTLSTATSGYKVSSLVDSTEDQGFARIVRTQDKLFAGTVTADNGVLTEQDSFFLLTSGVIRTTLWLGVADADLSAAMTTLATAPTGYTVLRVGNNYTGTGSCNVTRTMITKGAQSGKIKVGIEWPTFEGERITFHYPGLNKTDADALFITLQTEIVAGYKVDSVSIVESRYALTVVQQLSKVQVTPFTTSAVHRREYTHAFGLVTRATTVYLNVPFAEIGTVKTAILALADIIVLDISDNDSGQGSADITYIWRSQEAAPRALGTLQSVKPSAFHQELQERLWIDINLDSQTALADAVALALAGTAPYDVTASDTIQSASGQDAGDKTGRITQKLSKKPETYTAADFSMQESFNPHGLREATMLISAREYPEIAYADLATVFAELQAFLGDPMKGRIQVSLNANGTFMMRALKEGPPDWDNTTPAYIQTARENPGVIGERKTEQATGVPVAGAAAIVAAITADTNYQLAAASMTERGNGEAVIAKQQILKSETAVLVRAIPATGTQRAAEERIWPLVLNANVDTIWTAALTAGVAGDYILRYRQKALASNGMWQVTNLVEAATEVTVADFTAEIRADVVRTVERKQDAASLPVIASATGVNTSVDGRLNAHNKYDYQKDTLTAQSQEVSGSYADRYGTAYFWTGTYCTEAQYTAAIATAALSNATDNSVTKSNTQFPDLFNYSIVKRPYKPEWWWITTAVTSDNGPYTEVALEWNSDGSMLRRKTITFYVYYRTSETLALTAISGTGPGGHVKADGTQWKGKKVTNINASSWAPWIAGGDIPF